MIKLKSCDSHTELVKNITIFAVFPVEYAKIAHHFIGRYSLSVIIYIAVVVAIAMGLNKENQKKEWDKKHMSSEYITKSEKRRRRIKKKQKTKTNEHEK